jgi:hypothetical protein
LLCSAGRRIDMNMILHQQQQPPPPAFACVSSLTVTVNVTVT